MKSHRPNWIRIDTFAAFVLGFTFVDPMHAQQQSPAERVTKIQATLRFLNAE
jgi:hypothetical protein